MDIEHLREFRLLARELHFGRAADKSYASRTAFSRHIYELESYFGAQLVERSKPVRLTKAGVLLARYLEETEPGYYALKAALQEVAAQTVSYRRNKNN